MLAHPIILTISHVFGERDKQCFMQFPKSAILNILQLPTLYRICSKQKLIRLREYIEFAVAKAKDGCLLKQTHLPGGSSVLMYFPN